jgi:hypothetical protein
VLGPAPPTRWRRYADVAAIFAGPDDSDWTADGDRVAGEIDDPWLR